MGGCILLRALQTRRIELEAAAFSSPMWGILGLNNLATRYARFMVALGLGGMFAPGQQTTWKREAFKRNPVTHDKDRHARCQGLIAEEPGLALAGPTLGWVAAASSAIEGFHQPASLVHLKLPIVVVSAGQEQLVDNRAQIAVCSLLP